MLRTVSRLSESYLKFTIFQGWVWLLSATLFLGNFLYSLFSLVRFLWNWLRFGRRNKRVVIVGGGFAGTTVAKVLQNLMEVHLIDTKEFFEFTPSVLRVIVSPTQVKSIQVMHNNYLKNTTVHHGTVTEIKPEQNLVLFKHHPEESHNTNTLLPYDYLVICSGSSYHRPFKNPNLVISTRAKDLLAAADRVQDAETIVVIGGGTVGVEIAAEIITQYPNKKVSIVHSGKALLSRNGAPRAGAYAEEFFRKQNVQLILGEKVQIDSFEFEDSSGKAGVLFSTDKGTRINADLAFVCTGLWPNSEFLNNHADSSLGPQRFVKVNSFLQSELGSNVFVCGDVANIQEEKLAQAAGNSASVVSQNILRHASSKGKLKSYSSSDLPIIVSLGKYDAVFIWKNITFTGFLPALAKEAVQWKVMITF